MADNMLQIGDRKYAFGTIPATEAVVVEIAIARVIGEPLFKAFMDAKTAGSPEDDSNTAVASAVGLILSKMDSAELVKTMETVFKYVTVDGQRANIDVHFTGRNKELWQVFVGALRFNFSDFLPDALFASVHAKIGG